MKYLIFFFITISTARAEAPPDLVTDNNLGFVGNAVKHYMELVSNTLKRETCSQNPDRIGCNTLDTPEAATNPTDTRAVQYVLGTANTQSGCPPSEHLSNGEEIPMQPICDAAYSYIRPFVLIASSISAIYIFVAGLRNT